MIKLDPNKNVFGPDVPIWEYSQEGGRTRPIDIEISFQNLLEVKAVFDTLGIKFFLSHGTMLGVYREGDILKHDDDIDIGLFLEDKPKMADAMGELRARGFFVPFEGDPNKPVKGTGPDANMPYYDFVAIKNGEKVEGWFFELIGDSYIYDFPRCGNDLKHPRKYYDELQDYVWKGYTWKVPNHIKDWLVMMYGEKWYIEDKNAKYKNQS